MFSRQPRDRLDTRNSVIGKEQKWVLGTAAALRTHRQLPINLTVVSTRLWKKGRGREASGKNTATPFEEFNFTKCDSITSTSPLFPLPRGTSFGWKTALGDGNGEPQAGVNPEIAPRRPARSPAFAGTPRGFSPARALCGSALRFSALTSLYQLFPLITEPCSPCTKTEFFVSSECTRHASSERFCEFLAASHFLGL